MQRPDRQVSFVSRRRPRKRSRTYEHNDDGEDGYRGRRQQRDAAEPPIELPGEMWHAVISNLGPAEALGLGGVSRAFESGRRATLEREVAQTRRQVCPDPLACTRALLCAILRDDVDTVAAILSTGILRADVPMVHGVDDVSGLLRGMRCGFAFRAPEGVAQRDRGLDLGSTISDLTPLGLAAVAGSPRTVRLLGSRGVRPWPTVEALIESALMSEGVARDALVEGREGDQRFRTRPASDAARALIATFARTRPTLSVSDTHPLDVLREATLEAARTSTAHTIRTDFGFDPLRGTWPNNIVRDVDALLALLGMPTTLRVFREVVPRDSPVLTGSAILGAIRSDTLADLTSAGTLTMEEAEGVLWDAGAPSLHPAPDPYTCAHTARESFDQFVGRVVEGSVRWLDWPALTGDLLAAGYSADDHHVSVGALLNAAPGAADTGLHTPHERTIARARQLYDAPLHGPMEIIDAAVQVAALERLLVLFGDAA
ncbi:hypothetical protein psal_cds_348 [Pandoravirus salinus]|uniref:F-box incomplete domain containing protein n=1 Tax=Pandoravirus salinus TaxID=1349410 RepID=S4W0U0_9VIRU|nr:hypothetical protein psal_cds_348 [Pandoravirus salinus]AGO83992.1 hypothetical protein psal_cds_348 [Pandoravirus salinus]